MQSLLESLDFGEGMEFEMPRDVHWDSSRATSASTGSLPDSRALSDSSISGESVPEDPELHFRRRFHPPTSVERIRNDVVTPVHSEHGWFMTLLSFALFLVARAVLWTAQLGESRTALLPGGF